MGRRAPSGREVRQVSPRSSTRVVPPGYDAAVTNRMRVERSGPNDVIARVTLARPEVHNAFDASLIAELAAAFDGSPGRADSPARRRPRRRRAVVLRRRRHRLDACRDAARREGNEQDAMAMAEMFDAIDTCPVPVIARVQGAALGGGMGLCAVSDLVIAESGARFGFTETRLGILPAVIAPFVIAKIGESHARALFPGGRRFDALRALRIGLVHEVVEGEGALDAAVDAAVADILAAGPTAARAAKSIVREVRGLGHGSTQWHTARLIARQRTSAEAQEGLRAFTEKRGPAWARSRARRTMAEAPSGRLVGCVGCRGLVPDIDGPVHRYMTASPGCWRAYTELTAGNLGRPRPASSSMPTRSPTRACRARRRPRRSGST